MVNMEIKIYTKNNFGQDLCKYVFIDWTSTGWPVVDTVVVAVVVAVVVFALPLSPEFVPSMK